MKNQNSSPLVSIITPMFNAEEYIEDCINSVIRQSYKNWELLIIDDCSSDKSVMIVNKYLNDSRIKLTCNSRNLGPALSRNVALSQAKGDYITFLDSDDFLSPLKLEKQIVFMQKNQLKMSHGYYNFCNLKGETLKSVRVDEKIRYQDLLKGNQFKIMTVMLHNDLILNNKFENIKHEDYIFFLNCLTKIEASFLYSKEFDSFCRIGKVSVSSNKLKSALWTWRVYRNYLKLSLLKSVYYFLHYTYKGFVKYN